MKIVLCFLVVQIFRYGNTFIIPDEVPSLLSVIYSNIPTIKKGTDSRIGWGFRLGDHADIQILTELGPQQYTRPLANQPDNDNNNNKRQSVHSLSDVLYAQRLREKQLLQEKKEDKSPILSEGAKWLQRWSANQRKQPKAGLAIGEIDAKSVIAEDTPPL